MAVKPIAIVCTDTEAAKRMQAEYEYIGRRTRREGRVVIVKTSTL